MQRLLLLMLIKVTGERDKSACWDRGDKVNVAWRQRWLTDVILALALGIFFFFFLLGVGVESPVSQPCEMLAMESCQ